MCETSIKTNFVSLPKFENNIRQIRLIRNKSRERKCWINTERIYAYNFDILWLQNESMLSNSKNGYESKRCITQHSRLRYNKKKYIYIYSYPEHYLKRPNVTEPFHRISSKNHMNLFTIFNLNVFELKWKNSSTDTVQLIPEG